jgi:hypothetical protein
MPSIYLDTNVISGLAKGEYSEEVAAALLQITALSKAGRFDLYTSDVTAEELELIPQIYRRQHFVIYNLIKNIAGPAKAPPPPRYVSRGGRISVGRRPTGDGKFFQDLDALIPAQKNPNKSSARSRDIEHLYRFKESGLDFFLTEDHKSILRYRDNLFNLGLKVVSSLELLAKHT